MSKQFTRAEKIEAGRLDARFDSGRYLYDDDRGWRRIVHVEVETCDCGIDGFDSMGGFAGEGWDNDHYCKWEGVLVQFSDSEWEEFGLKEVVLIGKE